MYNHGQDVAPNLGAYTSYLQVPVSITSIALQHMPRLPSKGYSGLELLAISQAKATNSIIITAFTFDTYHKVVGQIQGSPPAQASQELTLGQAGHSAGAADSSEQIEVPEQYCKSGDTRYWSNVRRDEEPVQTMHYRGCCY